MKKATLFMVLLCSLWGLIFASQGYTKDKNQKEIRLIILPAKIDSANAYSIEDEVISQIADAAINSFRCYVFDRWNIMGLQLIQKDGIFIDSLLVKLGKNISATDILVVTVLNFKQQGIPPDLESGKKEAILGLAVELLNDEDEEEEKYASNVQTELAVQVDKIDIETGMTTRFFNVYAFHTGGNKEKYLAKVMGQVKKKAKISLRNLTASN